MLLFVCAHFKKLLIKRYNVILKSGKASYAVKDCIMGFNQ